MPLTGPITGFIYRDKGKGFIPSSALQQIGKSAASSAGGGNISVQLNASGVGNGADTTEDTLFSANLPANFLDVVGRELGIFVMGNIAATSATKTLKVYFGSSITTQVQATTTQTGIIIINMSLFKTASNTQLAAIQTDTTVSGSLVRTAAISAGTETDTAAITVKVTGQSSVATANLVQCYGMILSGYN